MIHNVDIFLGDSKEILSEFPDGYCNLMTSRGCADEKIIEKDGHSGSFYLSG